LYASRVKKNCYFAGTHSGGSLPDGQAGVQRQLSPFFDGPVALSREDHGIGAKGGAHGARNEDATGNQRMSGMPRTSGSGFPHKRNYA
jgi:hypothetical protein